MEIIRAGKTEKQIIQQQFECGNCGCAWRAYKGEYIFFVRGSTSETYVSMKCPWCGRWTDAEIREEVRQYGAGK